MKRAERLELARCLDDAHTWHLMDIQIEEKGRYRGSVRREKSCLVCESLKMEHIAFNGQVMSRSYRSGRKYIEVCRSLSKDVQERRVIYRQQMLKAMFNGRR